MESVLEGLFSALCANVQEHQRLVDSIRDELEHLGEIRKRRHNAIFDDLRRVVTFDGKSIEFGRKRLLYAVLRVIWESGDDGITEADLSMKIWGDECVPGDRVRKTIMRLRTLLASSGVRFSIIFKNSEYFFAWKKSM